MFKIESFECSRCGAITQVNAPRYGSEDEEVDCEWCTNQVGVIRGDSMEISPRKLIRDGKPTMKRTDRNPTIG